MITNLTKEDLINFENEIAECYNNKEIRAPVHLYSGNEEHMLNIFKRIRKEDWVFCSWRSHYQCLLKGVPKDRLKRDILDGKSISLCYPEYNIFSSGIVTGNIPIALGTALSLKRRGINALAFCFVGDMTSETGVFWESIKLAASWKLPIRFIVEDNDKSVCTPTRETWQKESIFAEKLAASNPYIYYYKYVSRFPHSGAGKRLEF